MMKRIVLFCLALLLLLSGCRAKPATGEFQKLTITVGSDEDRRHQADTVRSFYDSCTDGKLMELTICNVEDNGTANTRIQFDGKRYTVINESGEQTYSYLIYSVQETPNSDRGRWMECYLLSNDPEMTAQRYFDYVASSMPDPFFPDTMLAFSSFK